MACINSACLQYSTTCSVDDDCRSDFFCGSAGACSKRQAVAATCTAADQCVSNFCSDGVCCRSACTGVCESCVASTNGVADGTCSGIVAGTDPDNECFGDTACNGQAACDFKDRGKSCGDERECASGFCADGVCCDLACTGICQSCVASTNGVADGTCHGIIAGTDPNNECFGAVACNGKDASQAACDFSDLGKPCTDHHECDSDACADGVCCDSDCLGMCRSCLVSTNGVADGQCNAAKTGQDPHNPSVMCASKDVGAACSGAWECVSGFCADGVCCSTACDGPCMTCASTKLFPPIYHVGTCTTVDFSNYAEDPGVCDSTNAAGPWCTMPPCVCLVGGSGPDFCYPGKPWGTSCTVGADCGPSRMCSNGKCAGRAQ